MNYIFFGTPEFAAIILEKLIEAGFIPQAVVCNPDKPIGRKKVITPPPTKILAERYNIPLFQPEILANSKFQIPNSKFDFFIVAAYSQIIPKEILEIPRLGAIGVHPSFLPKYRGPSPIQAAILNGDEETGVSLFLVDEKVDHGPILAQRELEFSIFNFQFSILSQKLAELGADLLIETLPKFLAGKIKPALQDDSRATYTKKFETKDAYIEPKDLEKAQGSTGASTELSRMSSPQETRRLAIEIDRKIRALNPEPGTFTLSLSKGGLKRMKLLEAVLTPEGKLKLKKIQIEGKKPTVID